jgi:hypothetical protein
MVKYLLVVFLALALLMGCGGDDDGGPTQPQENQPPEIGDTHSVFVLYTDGVDYWYGPSGLIYCKVTDPDGLDDIKDVQWVSDIEGGNAKYADLYDDGTHGDITADDGTYSIDCDQYTVQYWKGDGEDDGVGAVYYFQVEDKMNHTDDTDPIEY